MADPRTTTVAVAGWGRERPVRIHDHKVEMLVTWATDPPGNTRESELEAALGTQAGWIIKPEDSGHRWLTLYLPDPRPDDVLAWLGGMIHAGVVDAEAETETA